MLKNYVNMSRKIIKIKIKKEKNKPTYKYNKL